MKLIIIAHDIRSTHNVGALLRTAEGLGVEKIFLTGYTPYPIHKNDNRLPHIAEKLTKQINKTSLGADNTLEWIYEEDVLAVLKQLKDEGYTITALEQTENSTTLNSFKTPEKLVLILGSEVEGVSKELLEKADITLEIPMKGQKESFNVVEAATMAMYHCLM